MNYQTNIRAIEFVMAKYGCVLFLETHIKISWNLGALYRKKRTGCTDMERGYVDISMACQLSRGGGGSIVWDRLEKGSCGNKGFFRVLTDASETDTRREQKKINTHNYLLTVSQG